MTVKALELIRVLDVRGGDGTYMTSLDPSLLVEAITFVVDLQTDASVLDLFAARRIVEGSAAAIAASRISEHELEDLRALLAEGIEAEGVEDLVAHDLQFHRSIVSAAGNPLLTTMADSLSSETTRARVWRGLTQQMRFRRPCRNTRESSTLSLPVTRPWRNRSPRRT